MRKSSAFIVVTAVNLTLFVLVTFLYPRLASRRDLPYRLVTELALSDLCLLTDAPYTRHPALADLHAPFQAHPSALDPFPGGSILPVPRTLHDFLDSTPAQHP